jgi:hypothetical protein
MKTQIDKAVAVGRLDDRGVDGVSGLSYRAHVADSRTLIASRSVDLHTLVIAEAIRRKTQAELQREAQREAAFAYEMPVQPEQNHDRVERILPIDFDE